jgi:hypothetical protein
MSSYSDFDEYLDRLGLSATNVSEEQLDKVLVFFQNKGNKEAFRTLIRGFFVRFNRDYGYSRWNKAFPPIAPEKVKWGIENGWVKFSDLSYSYTNPAHMNYVVSFFEEKLGMNSEELTAFAFKYDKSFYKRLIEVEILQNGKSMDNEALLGRVNLNLMTEDARTKMIGRSTQPEKVFKLLSPVKKISTAVSLLDSRFCEKEAIKKLIKPQLKIYLVRLIELEKTPDITQFGLTLMKSHLKDELK